MLDQFAQKLAERPDITRSLRVADVLDMGVPAGSMDLVLCTMALHWFDDRAGRSRPWRRPCGRAASSGSWGPDPDTMPSSSACPGSADPPILPELADSIVSNEIYPEEMRRYLHGAGLRELDLWVERRERRVSPEQYLDRMRAVASHLWAHRTPQDRDLQLARAEAALRDAQTDGAFTYDFTKLFVVAEAAEDR